MRCTMASPSPAPSRVREPLIHLVEGLEDFAALNVRDADAVVLNGECQHRTAFVRAECDASFLAGI